MLATAPTAIAGIYLLTPRLFTDERGYFLESYSQRDFTAAIGAVDFVQDNESQSSYGVVRGLHYQTGEAAQAKLVRVISGKILDVAVDLRKTSPTFGQTLAVELSGENKHQLFLPRGVAHGFAVLSETVIFAYKCDNFYSPAHERGIIFNDPQLNLDWQLPPAKIIVSAKDQKLPRFRDAEYF